MKKLIWTIPIIVAVAIVMALVTIKGSENLVSPAFLQNFNKPLPISFSTPIPTPTAPKTFQFDSSTDLNAELEKVNPQVLDSDFE